MRRSHNKTIFGIIALIVVALLAWFSFGPKNSHQAAKTVTIGVVGQTSEDQKIWDSVAETAKKKYGITIKIKNFTDYNQPNKALESGDIDLNAFQHYAFLKAWNKANKTNIVSIGDTYLAPIRLYSKKYKKLSDLPDGATIAIPNDASNESRALYLLKNAGLITLKSGNALKTVADIKENKKNLKIKEVAADQAARALASVDAAVINNSFAVPAKLGDKETLFIEPINKDSREWVNFIAATAKNKNNKTYLDVVKAFQTEKTKKLVKKLYGNSEVTAWGIKF
ncbi:MAG: MetQ/NlpA family ABC transporter substrate-binding protein [Lactobacillus sp.]|nr:MetQ/NlpA family ABC transporter substrate-binding protein [Lactobacillus sp.]